MLYNSLQPLLLFFSLTEPGHEGSAATRGVHVCKNLHIGVDPSLRWDAVTLAGADTSIGTEWQLLFYKLSRLELIEFHTYLGIPGIFIHDLPIFKHSKEIGQTNCKLEYSATRSRKLPLSRVYSQ